MARSAQLPPILVASHQFVARNAKGQDRTGQVLYQESKQVQRVLMGRVQILKHQAHRPLLGVRFQETSEHRGAQQPGLQRFLRHSLGERALLKIQVDQLPKKIGHIAHFAIVQDRGNHVSDLCFGRLLVHPFNKPKASPQNARENPVAGLHVACTPTVGPEIGVLGAPHLC